MTQALKRIIEFLAQKEKGNQQLQHMRIKKYKNTKQR